MPNLVRDLFLAVASHPEIKTIPDLRGAEYRCVRDEIEKRIERILSDAERELGNGC